MFTRSGFQFGRMRRVLEEDSADVRMTMGMHFMSLNWTLKN